MTETFKYRASDGGGKVSTGTIAADSRELVVSMLRERGFVPLAIDKQRTGGARREIRLRTKVKLRDLAQASRQLSTLINAGVPILKSLAILEQQTDASVLQTALSEIRLDVERGQSLSAAMARHPKVFNNLYVAMVRSGETGGVLDQVLERLASNLERDVSLRNKIRSAMTYPVVVVGFVSLIMTAMLVFIVPQFKSIYATLNGKLPLLTRVLLAVSDAFRHKFIFVAIFAIAIAYGLRRYTKTPVGRSQWDRLKLRLPIFGKLFQKTALARFARVLGVLNKSGVPILQSLDVVSETVNNSLMADAVKDVQASVKQGESLAKPLAKHKIFPPMVVQMLSVGEETGALDTMLEKVALFYDDEVSAAVDSLTSMIEPLLIFVIGGAVGVSVIALYLPMFNLINLIK
jgi:type IV pilus assembly protein PilC